jgi:hypothetical protein
MTIPSKKLRFGSPVRSGLLELIGYSRDEVFPN